ncbi:caspase family protein [Spirulina major]|jgi:hypothetical protein|uniref:caspase family protein n=1 Tax=Spirulina major TaxID=270636 RepID=UPI000933A1E1|nr:caspase family protein [Spirulina major]
MVNLSRRHFLQATGAALATAGLHQVFSHQQTVLAQPTRRKLALIVGINDYAEAPLKGCVNDAILQQRLLVHRFGFHPDDVVMLLDADATRQSILDAFEEHLIKQAKPGDVAMFHYSGHGSLVRDPHPIFVDRRHRGMNGTFVPVDSTLPSRYPDEGGSVNDIMGHTLFLLMSALKTENFTAVLDSCHAGGATRDLRVRSRDVNEKITIADAEKAYQEDWLARLDWTHDQFVERYRAGVANGVVLAGAQRLQLAIDEQFPGFSAGAFTYRLTQHLWQTETTPYDAIAHINRSMPRFYRQRSLWEAEQGSGYEAEPMYFIDEPNPTAAAIAVTVEGDRAALLIVGIHPSEITPGQVFQSSDRAAWVEVRDRQGLVAIGQVRGTLQSGTPLQLRR